jgi:hypothetical protein
VINNLKSTALRTLSLSLLFEIRLVKVAIFRKFYECTVYDHSLWLRFIEQNKIYFSLQKYTSIAVNFVMRLWVHNHKFNQITAFMWNLICGIIFIKSDRSVFNSNWVREPSFSFFLTQSNLWRAGELIDEQMSELIFEILKVWLQNASCLYVK